MTSRQLDWLQGILNSIGDAVILADADGVVLSLNLVAQALTGWNQDALGKPLATVFRTNRSGPGHTYVVARPGLEIPIVSCEVPVPDDQGASVGTLVVFRDVTENRQLQEELRQRANRLAEADRVRNTFLATLAHELRTPLAPIQNALQILRLRCNTDPETKWAEDVIGRQVQQMTRLVEDLLDVSRVTEGKISLRKEPVDLSTIVSRAVEMTQPDIDARHHALTISLPAGPTWLEADASRLIQILANLLNNAAKYTESGGQIWLTAEREDGQVVLRVRDTGVGISADYLPHVFDIFSQEDCSLERAHGGLGIGLNLVSNLVRMHGGTITVHSPGPGMGSEFSVRLPLAGTQRPPTPTDALDKPCGKTAPRRILVVDDNVDGARTLSMLLEKKYGHEVRMVHDGLAALETAQAWPPDIVLLDIGLPGMNGLDVARHLRADLHMTDVLLIAMSGYGQNEDRRRSREAGFNAHLVKPIELDGLDSLLTSPELALPMNSQITSSK